MTISLYRICIVLFLTSAVTAGGCSLFDRSKEPKALTLGSAAVAKAENNNALTSESDRLFELGKQQERLQQWNAAEQYYRDCAEFNRKHGREFSQGRALHRLAVIKARNRQFQESEHLFRTALPLIGQNNDFTCDFAQMYYDQKRYADSETLLKNALPEARSHKKTLLLLGYSIAMQPDREIEGLRYLKQALGEAGGLEELAKICRLQGKHSQADFAEEKARLARQRDPRLASLEDARTTEEFWKSVMAENKKPLLPRSYSHLSDEKLAGTTEPNDAAPFASSIESPFAQNLSPSSPPPPVEEAISPLRSPPIAFRPGPTPGPPIKGPWDTTPSIPPTQVETAPAVSTLAVSGPEKTETPAKSRESSPVTFSGSTSVAPAANDPPALAPIAWNIPVPASANSPAQPASQAEFVDRVDRHLPEHSDTLSKQASSASRNTPGVPETPSPSSIVRFPSYEPVRDSSLQQPGNRTSPGDVWKHRQATQPSVSFAASEKKDISVNALDETRQRNPQHMAQQQDRRFHQTLEPSDMSRRVEQAPDPWSSNVAHVQPNPMVTHRGAASREALLPPDPGQIAHRPTETSALIQSPLAPSAPLLLNVQAPLPPGTVSRTPIPASPPGNKFTGELMQPSLLAGIDNGRENRPGAPIPESFPPPLIPERNTELPAKNEFESQRQIAETTQPLSSEEFEITAPEPSTLAQSQQQPEEASPSPTNKQSVAAPIPHEKPKIAMSEPLSTSLAATSGVIEPEEPATTKEPLKPETSLFAETTNSSLSNPASDRSRLKVPVASVATARNPEGLKDDASGKQTVADTPLDTEAIRQRLRQDEEARLADLFPKVAVPPDPPQAVHAPVVYPPVPEKVRFHEPIAAMPRPDHSRQQAPNPPLLAAPVVPVPNTPWEHAALEKPASLPISQEPPTQPKQPLPSTIAKAPGLQAPVLANNKASEPPESRESMPGLTPTTESPVNPVVSLPAARGHVPQAPGPACPFELTTKNQQAEQAASKSDPRPPERTLAALASSEQSSRSIPRKNTEIPPQSASRQSTVPAPPIIQTEKSQVASHVPPAPPTIPPPASMAASPQPTIPAQQRHTAASDYIPSTPSPAKQHTADLRSDVVAAQPIDPQTPPSVPSQPLAQTFPRGSAPILPNAQQQRVEPPPRIPMQAQGDRAANQTELPLAAAIRERTAYAPGPADQREQNSRSEKLVIQNSPVDTSTDWNDDQAGFARTGSWNTASPASGNAANGGNSWNDDEAGFASSGQYGSRGMNNKPAKAY